MRYEEPRNSIGVVARRTGLSQHVIRVWERRYRAIAPARTGTQRRLYSDADIDRLRMLQRLTAQGHPIGQVAHRANDELVDLLRAAETAPADAASVPMALPDEDPEACLDTCRQAVLDMDAGALESALVAATRAYSLPLLLDGVIVPLLRWAGDAWQAGTLRVAHEHLMSAVVGHQLAEIRTSRIAPANAPAIVVATPAGQHHELGAALAAAAAAFDGWRVIYLGSNLPADEIANAAVRTGARAVALSLVFPPGDPLAERELLSLRRFLPGGVQLLIGGHSACGYHDALDAAGARVIADLHGLHEALAALRQG